MQKYSKEICNLFFRRKSMKNDDNRRLGEHTGSPLRFPKNDRLKEYFFEGLNLFFSVKIRSQNFSQNHVPKNVYLCGFWD